MILETYPTFKVINVLWTSFDSILNTEEDDVLFEKIPIYHPTNQPCLDYCYSLFMRALIETQKKFHITSF